MNSQNKSPPENIAEIIKVPEELSKDSNNGPAVQQQQKIKRKHRRGKPNKSKNANKPYKTNWKFQPPRLNNLSNKCAGGGVVINGGGPGNGAGNRRAKLQRSRSLVPYNTNKFLMEEHLAEVPSALLTPTGRTRDSSFSMDSEDNYFYSLPEDEEEFLTKEFANVYEKARVERLENLSKQELIEECLQIEDRYSKDQGTQRQLQFNVQRVASEYLAKIRVLDEKVRELSRENHNLRCQLMRSASMAAAAAASPPSATAPIGSACHLPIPMNSSSEDSESDSSTTSSSSSSTSSSSSASNNDEEDRQPAIRRRSCSTHSSDSEKDLCVGNNYINNEKDQQVQRINGVIANDIELPNNVENPNMDNDYEEQQLLAAEDYMDDEESGGVGGGGGGGGSGVVI